MSVGGECFSPTISFSAKRKLSLTGGDQEVVDPCGCGASKACKLHYALGLKLGSLHDPICSCGSK